MTEVIDNSTIRSKNEKNSKRTRLIEAADRLFHEQGINITTLANIADLAQVPLGNVYYYFKSKESIVEAVIEARKKEITALFANWNSEPNSKSRLKAFINHFVTLAPKTAASGDALGSLAHELSKQGGTMASSSAGLLKEIVSWCEKQFTDLGKGSDAPALALNLVAGLQGVSLLTAAFKDEKCTNNQANYLINWLEANS